MSKIYGEGYRVLSWLQEGQKRRISTNRIHLCPSSTLLINPIWDVQSMRLGLGSALPGEERVRNVLSQSSWRRTKAGIWP